MSYSSGSNRARNFRSTSRFALGRFWNYSPDYSLNCTPLGPITITNYYHFVGHCGAFCGLKCSWARWNKPIKNENQTIVRSKQPIKIEKPFQSLMTFSHSAGEKNILQSVLLSFFSVFIFSMPSKVILIVIEFMFLGINMFWVRLRLILARAARHIYARKHKLYCYIIGGRWKL